MTFDLRADREVTVTGLAVETRNDLAARQFVDRDTTVGRSAPPSAVSGDFTVALRDIGGSGNLGVGDFVEPAGDEADFVVTIEFDDGSSRTVGIG